MRYERRMIVIEEGPLLRATALLLDSSVASAVWHSHPEPMAKTSRLRWHVGDAQSPLVAVRILHNRDRRLAAYPGWAGIVNLYSDGDLYLLPQWSTKVEDQELGTRRRTVGTSLYQRRCGDDHCRGSVRQARAPR
jgi:hypothetical protein